MANEMMAIICYFKGKGDYVVEALKIDANSTYFRKKILDKFFLSL